jgi:hypothetical protein
MVLVCDDIGHLLLAYDLPKFIEKRGRKLIIIVDSQPSGLSLEAIRKMGAIPGAVASASHHFACFAPSLSRQA